MEIISIPQVRLGQLQSLAATSLDLTQSITLLSSAWKQTHETYKAFLEGIQKDAASSDKKTLDKTRDQLLSGFFFAVKSEEYFTYVDQSNPEIKKELSKLMNEFGIKITRLPYDEETAAIDNLITALEALDLSSFDNLSRWIQPIKTANENFKNASKDYLEQVVTAGDVASASAKAPLLLSELENLYVMLFAHAKVCADDDLIHIHAQLSELVDSFR